LKAIAGLVATAILLAAPPLRAGGA